MYEKYYEYRGSDSNIRNFAYFDFKSIRYAILLPIFVLLSKEVCEEKIS